MKKNEIKVGGHYTAKVSENLVTVRVDGIEDRPMGFGKAHTAYHVLNLATGRKTTFRSAAKFREAVTDGPPGTPWANRSESGRIQRTGVTVSESVSGGKQSSDPTEKSTDGSNGSAKPSNAIVAAAPTPTVAVLRSSNVLNGLLPKPSAPSVGGTGLAGKIASRTLPGDTAPHVIVEARAGTGKTTTLVEALKRLQGNPTPGFIPSPQQAAVFEAVAQSRGKVRTIAFCAFNKSIREELETRVPVGVKCRTIHQLGFIAVQKVHRLDDNHGVNENRTKNILAELTGRNVFELRKERPILVSAVFDLVGYCKQNLWGFPGGDTRTLEQIADHYEVDTENCWEEVQDLVPRVLDRAKDVAKDRCIDYDDMVWLPVVLKLPLYKFDLLMIDEAQDLNRAQQAVVRGSGNRLVFCGDPRQAIYGFAGADSESMRRLYLELQSPGKFDPINYIPGTLARGCTVLPLTVTRRCGKKIVEEAKRLVPDFEAFPTNPEGIVRSMKYPVQPGKTRGETVLLKDEETYLPDVRDGDMIVSRGNAPLTKQCLKFLRLGRRARIQGRNIGDNLVSLIRKMEATSIPDLITKLSGWKIHETSKEQAKPTPDEGKLDKLNDRFDSVMCFVEDTDVLGTVDSVCQRIDSVFVNDPTIMTAPILLSSVHRAKGLESKRVFFLRPAVHPTRFRMPDWQRKQETNLEYVAITRAIEELIYVS